MKWLITFLAFYLLGLSLWPCADEALPLTGRLKQAVRISASGAVPGSTHEQHDLCAPFCTCACCTATIIATPLPQYQLLPVVAPLPRANRPAYTLLRWADPLSAIWQPPNLRV